MAIGSTGVIGTVRCQNFAPNRRNIGISYSFSCSLFFCCFFISSFFIFHSIHERASTQSKRVEAIFGRETLGIFFLFSFSLSERKKRRD